MKPSIAGRIRRALHAARMAAYFESTYSGPTSWYAPTWAQKFYGTSRFTRLERKTVMREFPKAFRRTQTK